MFRLFLLTCLVLSIVYQNQVYCQGEYKLGARLLKLNDHVGTSSSVITLKSYADRFLKYDVLDRGSYSKIMNEIRIINSNMKHSFTEIFERIADLPNILEYLHESNSIIQHVSRIGEIFRLALREVLHHGHGESQSLLSTTYFKQIYSPLLENSMIEIRRVFTEHNTIAFLGESYSTSLKKYATTCHTNMSQLQVLDDILGLVRAVYSEYYQTKTIIFDKISYEAYSEDVMTAIKNEIDSGYRSIVAQFKKIMTNSSKEILKCDPRTGTDSPYYELRQFSTYIGENEVGKACSKDTSPILDKSECKSGDPQSLCLKTRPCGKGYLSCKRMRPDHVRLDHIIEGYYVCYNSDVTATDRRYYEIVHDVQANNGYQCKAGVPLFVNYIRGNWDFCDCLCLDDTYYFDANAVTSNYNDNKVITGAKLAVKNNIIYIQIQEATLLKNAKTENGSAIWKTGQETKKMNPLNSKHTLESVDLTEIKDLPTDKVIVGLKFVQSPNTRRVQLSVLTAKFDFHKGTVTENKDGWKVPKDATNKYEFDDEDVPTSATQQIVPISNANQYVSFNITSALKDAGQTTIPFIDTQKVESLRPMPLSGAGLYLKGQPGFGGFIGIKLYTYDIVPYIDDRFYG